MKIAIYSPYLDTTGGGEKYMMTIAETLSQNAEVEVLLDTHLATLEISEIIKKIERLHKIDLTKVTFVKSPLGAGSSTKARFSFLKQYDWLIALTDGSIFYSSAKHSLLHFQVPFENTKRFHPWQRLKIASWEKAIYNSQFSKQIIEKTWPIKGQVLYPPVSVDEFHAGKKKNQIVTTGRFFGFTKAKKQEVMIKAFKELVDDKKIADWSFHLVGAATEGDTEYVTSLKEQAKGYPIFFHPNALFSDLVTLYGESKIYWHAAGFEEADPKMFEHFGITTVEAMASGCVPIVIGKGGQLEIVSNGENGYLWHSLEELKTKTVMVVMDETIRQKLSLNAISASQKFDKKHFCDSVKKIVYGKN
jgi:glycosyltransferase involved in cell wall biosynthesis